MATLYFNNAVDTDYGTLGNWWQSYSAGVWSVPAVGLPTGDTDVIVNDPDALGIGGDTGDLICLTATFNDTSFNQFVSITGDATFNDSSYNRYSIITGDATFNDYAYSEGESIGGTTTYSDGYHGAAIGSGHMYVGNSIGGSGWVAYCSAYFIDGSGTNLDINGDGVLAGSGALYSGGALAYGVYNGVFYDAGWPSVGQGGDGLYYDGYNGLLTGPAWWDGGWPSGVMCIAGVPQGDGYSAYFDAWLFNGGRLLDIPASGTGNSGYTYSWWIEGVDQGYGWDVLTPRLHNGQFWWHDGGGLNPQGIPFGTVTAESHTVSGGIVSTTYKGVTINSPHITALDILGAGLL